MEKVNYAELLADKMLEGFTAESAIEILVEDFAEQLERAEIDAIALVDEEMRNSKEWEEERESALNDIAKGNW